MRNFTSKIKNSTAKLATVFTTLLVGLFFGLVASTAAAGGINKPIFGKPPVVINVAVKNQAVIPAAKSDAALRSNNVNFNRPNFNRPNFNNPFFGGFDVNPFFGD